VPITGVRSNVPAAAGVLAPFATTKSIVPTTGLIPELTRSTAGVFTNAAGYIESAGANQPRPHHYYIGGSLVSAGLLLEPARTNKLLKTNALEHAYWTASNLTVDDAAATGPDGTTSATRLTEPTDTAQLHRIFQQTQAVVSGQKYVASFFAKAETRTQIVWQSTSFFTGIIPFNLSSGRAFIDTNNSGAVGWVEPYPNGWYRCCVMNTAVGSGSPNFILALYSDTTATYNGNGSTLLVWGPQLELATDGLPSSYILSEDDYTARGADSLLYDSTDFSSVYDVSDTIMLSTRSGYRSSARTLLKINDGTANNEIKLETNSSGYLTGSILSASGSQFSDTISSRFKDFELQTATLASAANNVLMAKSGLAGTADTAVAMPINPTQMLICPEFNGCLSELRIYNSRKSNLTTQALSGTLRAATQPATYKPTRIICDGNSLTYGAGSDTGGTYPQQLEALLQLAWDHAYTVYNLGVSGQTINDMNSDRVAQVHPLIVDGATICIVWEGANGLNGVLTAA